MIGNKIKNIRIGLGMTMEEFGRQFNPEVDKSIISKWESNGHNPNNERIKRIAELGAVSVEELLNSEPTLYKFNDDISYDLNSEVPKLYIKGKEVGVVSMTRHYMTSNTGLGTDTITFIYMTKDSPEQKVLSINNLGEVFEQ